MTTLIEHPTAPLVIRIAEPSDGPALQFLAELDSVLPFTGAALIAELDGQMVAGISLANGREVADPFVPTTEILELLRIRAKQLKPRLAPRAPFAKLRLMRIPRARSLRLLLH
jgi:hypothetical protein